MKKMPTGSVDLICTSVPFALVRKKEYGNEDAADYVEWFRPFAEQFHRILSDEGNLVIHIGGAWNKGEPTKSLYTYQFLIALVSGYEKKFKLCQDFFFYNPAKLPSPAEWVTVRRIRVKDAVDFVWWLSKSSNPKADNRRVLKLYSESMKNLLRNGYKAKQRPSGHKISTKFSQNQGGAIPSNLLMPSDLLAFSNTESMGDYQKKCREFGLTVHPARFQQEIPEFFIRFLTDPESKILDPFGGSNVTGYVAELMGRRWMGIEILEEYLKGSMFRFKDEQILSGKQHIANLKAIPA
ncbi:MAG: site-specific DNA-methyltransferase [Candidatus Micrarchaeota archaeon]|nr:site-specific DNA-methyltransferase [Candidatus Micrarchaeota archaeon]